MKVAVYPGSFDPPTYGHLDVIERAAALFDQLVVAVLHNPDKRPLFSVEQRKQFLSEATAKYPNVSVDSFEGLLVEYVKMKAATGIVRGLREISDFETEMRMANMNRAMYEQAVTVFVPTSHQYAFVSSSLVKDIARHGGDVSSFVPPSVRLALSSQSPK